MKIRREVPHTLAGAYALDALTEPDRVRFERHLAGCEACRQEASSLREAAGRLTAVSAVPPPAHVREQVLAEAARTRQQPPLTVDAPAGSGAGRRAVRWRAPRMAVAIAGGCILVALVLGGLFIHTQRSLSVEQAHNRAIATILNAPDATIMSATKDVNKKHVGPIAAALKDADPKVRMQAMTALSTLGNQIATAIHIAELRRPLLGTVEQISQQVTALARVTESLRASALAMADASHGMRQGAGELETFVAGGLQATDSLGAASRAMADQGARAAAASGTAAEVATQKRAVRPLSV